MSTPHRLSWSRCSECVHVARLCCNCVHVRACVRVFDRFLKSSENNLFVAWHPPCMHLTVTRGDTM